MKQQIQFNCAHNEVYSRIAQRKQHDLEIKRRIKLMLPTINDRFSEYQSKQAELSQMIKYEYNDLEVQNGFYSFYESAEVTRIKSEIRKINTLPICPYCGLGEPTTFDHILPRSTFPEFSAFAPNLIPVCGTCNSNFKKNLWLDANDKRLFINFYSDPVEVEQFLFATISVEHSTVIPEFYLKFGSAVGEAFAKIISNHFEQLNLLARLSLSANSCITEVINSKNRDVDLIKRYLSDQAIVYRITYGVNSWKEALYQGLANSDAFVEYCASLP